MKHYDYPLRIPTQRQYNKDPTTLTTRVEIGQESKRRNRQRHGRLLGDSVQYCLSPPLPPLWPLSLLTHNNTHRNTNIVKYLVMMHRFKYHTSRLVLFKFKLKLSQIRVILTTFCPKNHILALKV